MQKIVIPTYWETFEDGNAFYTQIATEAYEALEQGLNPENVILSFFHKNRTFVDSEKGQEADASAKETQNRLIDFITEITETYGYKEEDIVSFWENTFF